jgi:hypothetical protein
LRILRGRESLVIDTGVLRVTVDTQHGGFITDIRMRNAKGRWQPLLQPGGLRLYVNRCGPNGEDRRRYANGPDTTRDRRSQPHPPAGFERYAVDPAYTVKVVEEGPERVGVRVGGTHVDAAGRRLCPYVVHLYAYRQSARLDLQHTLVYTGVPQQDLIAGFGVEVPLRLERAGRRYHFAEDVGSGIETTVQPTPEHPQWLYGRLVQMASTAYRMEKRTDQTCGFVKIAEGGRNQGWAHLGDENTGCLAAIRDFWQQYPKAFEVDAGKGLLRVELWPTSGEPWDLRRYSHNWHKALYEYTRADLWKEFPEETHGARGIAKTHEFALCFHAEPPVDRQALARTALACNQPLMLRATPAWYCGTAALGAVQPHTGNHLAAIERVVTGYVDFMLAERERNKWYGMVDYGDMQMTCWREDYNAPQGPDDLDKYRWFFDIGGHAWLNAEARPDQGLWLTFFSTGRTDCFDAAAAMTRHNRDVDCYHWGNFKGSGSRHNVNHWGCCDKEWRVSNPISLRWHYYLTGDAWTREVIGEALGTYQSYRPLSTSTAAAGGAVLCGLLVKAEFSGEDADLQAVRNLADVYAGAVLPNGSFCRSMTIDPVTGEGAAQLDKDMESGTFFLLGFGGMQTLVEVAELLEHDALSDALVRHAYSRFEPPPPGGNPRLDGPYAQLHVQLMSFAWRRTGDVRFLRTVRKILREHRSRLQSRGRKGGVLEPIPHAIPVYALHPHKQSCWMLGDTCVQTAFGLSVLASGAPEGGTRLRNAE